MALLRSVLLIKNKILIKTCVTLFGQKDQQFDILHYAFISLFIFENKKLELSITSLYFIAMFIAMLETLLKNMICVVVRQCVADCKTD